MINVGALTPAERDVIRTALVFEASRLADKVEMSEDPHTIALTIERQFVCDRLLDDLRCR